MGTALPYSELIPQRVVDWDGPSEKSRVRTRGLVFYTLVLYSSTDQATFGQRQPLKSGIMSDEAIFFSSGKSPKKTDSQGPSSNSTSSLWRRRPFVPQGVLVGISQCLTQHHFSPPRPAKTQTLNNLLCSMSLGKQVPYTLLANVQNISLKEEYILKLFPYTLKNQHIHRVNHCSTI